MRFNLDEVFAPFQRALEIGNQRMEVLAANLANADTPGFKAQDVDFKSAMQAEGEAGLALSRTSAGHILEGSAGTGPAEVFYRSMLQASVDGNTVDTDRENAAVAEAAIRYEAALMFFSSKIRGLQTAIKGE